MKLLKVTLRGSKLWAIALTLSLPTQAQSASLREIAQQYVDQNPGNNPLAILADNGCQAALVGTTFQPTVSNCSQLRNYAYQYWEGTYSPGGSGR